MSSFVLPFVHSVVRSVSRITHVRGNGRRPNFSKYGYWVGVIL